MRFLIFALMVIFLSCGSETNSTEINLSENTPTQKDSTTVITPAPTPKGYTDVNAKYKKTAENSEFAVFKTTSATDTEMEFYFKTLDGISIKSTYLHEGGRKVVGFNQLLEFAKYMKGYPGANGDMAGKIFELIYNENNDIGEVRLAELED
ncbi:MAG: hypothetical protein P8Q41_02765 [Saprospiraceae bacterium]|jgi:exonuclease III|nr:hypothetical protein [Saprospiraceae bacterium]